MELQCFYVTTQTRIRCICHQFSSVAQSCPTLCNSRTTVHQAALSKGILQARILEWFAVPSSRGSSRPRDQTHVSCVAGRFFTTSATSEAHKDGAGLAKSCTKTKFLPPINSRPPIFLRRNSRMNEKSKYEERKNKK